MSRLGLVVFALVVTGFVIASSAMASAANGRAKWTIMIYMDADNNLEPAAILDLEELERVGSSNSVKIVVLIDRNPRDYETSPILFYYSPASYGSWSDTRIYLVEKHPGPGIGSKLLARLGERDTGDPSTLLYFVKYVVERFPAEHYMLILWNHGSGVSIAIDDSSHGDVLTLPEIRSVLAKLRASGIHIDVIGFDACLMASLEAMHAVADYVDYMVASEENEPGYSWPFDTIMARLVENPSMSPRELLELIVDSYGAFYEEAGYPATTLSAFDLRGISSKEIASAIAELAKFTLQHPGLVHGVRDAVQEYGTAAGVGGITVDYVQLVKGLERHGLGGEPVALAEKLLGSRIANYAGPERRGSQGVSIFFPRKASLINYYLRSTSLGESTGWAKALLLAINVAPQVGEQPVVDNSVSVSEEVASTSGGETGYQLPSALGRLQADKRPGDEIVLVLATSAEKNGDEYMASTLLVLSLRGKELRKIVERNIEVAKSPDDFLFPQVAKSRDIDGDGVEEVFIADQLYAGDELVPETHLFLVDPGTGKVLAAAKATMFVVAGIAMGDINGDGKPELLLAGTKLEEQEAALRIYGRIYVLDPSSLRPIDKIDIGGRNGRGVGVSGIALADIDGDGVEEIIVSTNYYDEEYNHLGDLDAILVISYKGGKASLVGRIKYSARGLAVGDIDADNVLELIASSYDGPALRIIKLSRRGPETLADIVFRSSGYNAVSSATPYDIDGDGVLELVVFLLKLDEDGVPEDAGLRVISFTAKPSLEYKADNLFTSTESRIPLAADINGDGRSELVYISMAGMRVEVKAYNVTNYVYTKGSLKGIVRDNEGNPLKGAKVVVTVPRQEGSNKTYVAVTDENGRYEIRGVPAASYDVLVLYKGRLVKSLGVVIEAGKTRSLNIEVELGGSPSGTETGTNTQTTTSTSTNTATTTTSTANTETRTSTKTTKTTTTPTTTSTQNTQQSRTSSATTTTTHSTRTTSSKEEAKGTKTTGISINITLPISPGNEENTPTSKQETKTKTGTKAAHSNEETGTTRTPGTIPETTKALKRDKRLYYAAPLAVLVAVAAYALLARRRQGPELPPPPPPPG